MKTRVSVRHTLQAFGGLACIVLPLALKTVQNWPHMTYVMAVLGFGAAVLANPHAVFLLKTLLNIFWPEIPSDPLVATPLGATPLVATPLVATPLVATPLVAPVPAPVPTTAAPETVAATPLTSLSDLTPVVETIRPLVPSRRKTDKGTVRMSLLLAVLFVFTFVSLALIAVVQAQPSDPQPSPALILVPTPVPAPNPAQAPDPAPVSDLTPAPAPVYATGGPAPAPVTTPVSLPTPELGGCTKSGLICFQPSSAVGWQLNLKTGDLARGTVLMGYGLVWHGLIDLGAAIYGGIGVSSSEPSAVQADLLFNIANYLAIGPGIQEFKGSNGSAVYQWLLTVAVNLNVAGTPKYLAKKRP